jgi:HK97 family phage major capsid protein
MSTVKALLEARANKITLARQEKDSITDKSTDDEKREANRKFKAYMAEAEQLLSDANDLRALEEAEASLEQGDDRRPNAGGEHRTGDQGAGAIEYRDAFHAMLQQGGDVHAMSPEMRQALARGEVAKGMNALSQEARAQIAGSAAAGGHLVPEATHTAIVKAMEAWGPMFDDNFGNVLNTPGGEIIPIPGVDDRAGRAAQEQAEGDAFKNTGSKDVVFTRKELRDYLFDTEFLKVSIQLLTGSYVGVQELLASLLGERLGRTANHALTLGDGASGPLGVVPGATKAFDTVGTSSLTADEIQKLVFSVNSAYRRSPKFGLMFNDNTLLALHGMKDGQGNYLLSEAPDAEGVLKIGATKARYTINNDVPDMGAGNRSMIAGDFSKYWVRKVGNVMIVTARDSQFLPGFGMAGFARFDGTIADPLAIKALEHATA